MEDALFEMDEAALNGDRSSVCAVTDAQLAEQVIDVGFDCRLGDRKISRNLLVRTTSNNALEDAKLTGSKILCGHALSELFGYGRRDAAFAGVHQSYGFEQIIDGHPFKQIGLGPGL
jgi:hypothetical protein